MSDLKDAQQVIWDFSDNIVYIYLFSVWTIVDLLATRLASIAVLLISFNFQEMVTWLPVTVDLWRHLNVIFVPGQYRPLSLRPKHPEKESPFGHMSN